MRPPREALRQRAADALRLVAACALLLAVLGFFRVPLALVLGLRLSPWLPALRQPAIRLAHPRPPAAPADPGFVIAARSIPPGGRIAVDGADRGPLPALVNVACRAGEEVEITVQKPGYPPWQRRVACREGTSLVVRARLGEPAAGD
ncbi:MAG: PEGA domain-containing protein [Acidobacteria bacterium]|nr:MAG: PEGA domain-containing protein [Acidobacteriota bacterium]